MDILSLAERLRESTRQYAMILRGKARDLPLAAMITAYLIFVATWSYIGIAKYYSLTASVYDLGISMQSAYILAYHFGSFGVLLRFLLARNGLALLMIPVAILENYPLMIAIQASVVGAAMFPIYGIASCNGFKKSESSLIALSYLIFFPLSGLLWFDFHYQMFFVFLFLLAYYFYKKRMLKLSWIIFLLSGFCRYPFIIFPFLFSVILIVEMAHAKLLQHKGIEKSEFSFSVTLMIASLVFLAVGDAVIGGITNVPLHMGATINPAADIEMKLVTIVILFGPLLFLPLTSHRAVILSIPFLYLVFTSNTGTYTVPGVLQRQYSAGIVPFLYIGFIEGLTCWGRTRSILSATGAWLIRYLGRHPAPMRLDSKVSRNSLKKSDTSRRAIIVVLCVLAISSIFAQPYGPLNYLGDNFHLQAATDINMSVFGSLENVLSMIPANESHVSIQNNIVEALPGPIGQTLLVPQYDVGPNITYSEITNNTFPVREGNIVTVSPIDYVVADVNDQNTFLQPGLPNFPNMFELCKMLLSSHYYGIRAEENGVILLQRGYVGQAIFAPFSGDYQAHLFRSLYAVQKNGLLQASDPPAGTILWNGPIENPYFDYLSLIPGVYSASFTISANAASNSSALYIEVTANTGTVLLNGTVVYGNELSGSNSATTISLVFYVNNVISGVEFQAVSDGWNGTVSLRGAHLQQIGTIPANQIGGVPGMIGLTPPAGTIATASSTLGSYVAQNAIDADLNTAWISSTVNAHITLHFPTSQQIAGVDIALGSVPSSSFNITVMVLSTGWMTVYDNTTFVTGGPYGFTMLTVFFTPLNCTKLEVDCSSPISLIRINEITIVS